MGRRLDNGRCMSGDVHVQCCEQRWGRFLTLTHLIITGKTKECLEQEVKPLVIEFLAQRGLQLSEEKTKITHIGEGFDFLGATLRKHKGVLLTTPSKRNVEAFLGKVKAIIQANKQAAQVTLIRLLNPLIRGWSCYHQHGTASHTFNVMDRQIWVKLWQWAKRRHPNKTPTWRKNKYFRRIGERDWVFCAQEKKSSTSPPRLVKLYYPTDTKIRHHVKIKGLANPFDPQWNDYFKARLAKKVEISLKGQKKKLGLWKEQQGECLICHQEIEDDWHVHHIIERSQGGSDENDDLVLLHPDCHRQVHSQKIEVVKPACPSR